MGSGKERSDNRLGLSDLDPKLAKLVRERIAHTQTYISGGIEQTLGQVRQRVVSEQAAMHEGLEPIVTLQAHERADLAIRAQHLDDERTFRGRVAKLCAWLVVPPTVLAVFFITIFALVGDQNAPFLYKLDAALVTLLALSITHLVANRRKRRCPTAATLAAVLRSVANTASEQSYASVVGEVFSAQDIIGHSEAHGMIRSLNSLLESERFLGAQADSLARGMNSAATITEIERERSQLQARVESAIDPLARETLTESLAMCQDRLDRALRLAPLRERIDAQQESIRQTMKSVQTSLAGLTIASSDALVDARDAALMQSSQGALRETTQSLQSRATAVEKAVQEVARIRVGG